jgi:hypothetical protein
MTGISRGLRGRASWLCLAALACGGGGAPKPGPGGPAPLRAIPAKEALVLENAGPPPSDTSVTFRAGERRAIVLRHGPPDNVTFARLDFAPEAFGPNLGQEVRVEVRPHPGVYGLDIASTVPFGSGATLAFYYARYFTAPARARQLYGNDVVFERALAIWQNQPNSMLGPLSPTRPALDMLSAQIPGPGGYLVAAPPP